MKRQRGRNPDKMPPKRNCGCHPARPIGLVAEMAQVDPESRMAHILARRAHNAGVLPINAIDGKLTGTRFTRASERSSLRWIKNEPDLPERMIRTGQMSVDDVPLYLRSFLRL